MWSTKQWHWKSNSIKLLLSCYLTGWSFTKLMFHFNIYIRKLRSYSITPLIHYWKEKIIESQSIGTCPTPRCWSPPETCLFQFCNQLKNSQFWFQEVLFAQISITKLSTAFQNSNLSSKCSFLFKIHIFIFFSLCLGLIS